MARIIAHARSTLGLRVLGKNTTRANDTSGLVVRQLDAKERRHARLELLELERRKRNTGNGTQRLELGDHHVEVTVHRPDQIDGHLDSEPQRKRAIDVRSIERRRREEQWSGPRLPAPCFPAFLLALRGLCRSRSTISDTTTRTHARCDSLATNGEQLGNARGTRGHAKYSSSLESFCFVGFHCFVNTVIGIAQEAQAE